MLMEKCWDLNPRTRPQVADVLVFFESASRRWVSPSSEAVADLSLSRLTNQNPHETEFADTMSDTGPRRLEVVL